LFVERNKMPWANIPKSKWPAMEKCVNGIMANSSFKPQKGRTKEESAHAICYSRIMGKNDMTEEEVEKRVWSQAEINNFPDSSFAYISGGGKKDSEGKTVPRSLRHLPYKDVNGKIDPAHVRNALARLSQTNIPETAKASTQRKLMAAAKQVGIEVSEKIDTFDEQEGGERKMAKKKIEELKKQDELVVEEPEKEIPEKEVNDEVPKEEAPVKEEEVPEVPAEEPAPAPVKEAPAEEVNKLDDALAKIGTILQKLDDLAKQDAPVAPVVEEPEVEEPAPAPVKEAPAEEEEPEEIQKISASIEAFGKKVDGVSEKISSFEERIKKLEEQEIPSKVSSPKVVTRGGEPESTPRVEEIKKRLDELEEMKNKNLAKYQEGKYWEEAFSLIAERDELLAKA